MLCHRCLRCIVDSGSTVHRHASVDAATVSVGIGSVGRLFYKFNELLVDWNDATLRAKLDLRLPIVSVRHPTSVALKLPARNKDHLSDKFVSE